MEVFKDGSMFTGRCSISLLCNQEDRLNESYYAPLFFAEFEDEENKEILCFSNSPLNRKHPFSKWLLSITPKLYHNYREIFNAIIICFDDFDFINAKQTAKKLNDILKNLAEINPKLKMAEEITINYKSRMLY